MPLISPPEKLRFATEMLVSISRYLNSALTSYRPAPASVAPGARMYGAFVARLPLNWSCGAGGHVERRRCSVPLKMIASAPVIDVHRPGVVEGRPVECRGSGPGVDDHGAGVVQGAPAGGRTTWCLPSSVSWPPDMLLNVPEPLMESCPSQVTMPELSSVQPVEDDGGGAVDRKSLPRSGW